MKALFLIVLVGVCLGCPNIARAQAAFRNLDFEMAQVPAEPTYGLAIDSALPGWGGFAATLSAFGVMYDIAFLDSPQIGVYDSRGDSSLPPNLFGKYSAFLMADFAIPPSSRAEIFQTGLIPEQSKSLRFATSADPLFQGPGLEREDWRLTLLINGSAIPYLEVEKTPNYIVWGADVSSLAGSVAEVRFSLDTSMPSGGDDTGVAVGLDAIEFSPTAIPEPALVHLLLLAFGMAYLNNARRRHNMITTHADLELRSEVRTSARMTPDL